MTGSQLSAGSGATAAGSDAATERIRAALAYACGHEDELREDLSSCPPGPGVPDPAALVDALADAFAAGQPCGPQLDAIHAALQAGADALGIYGRIKLQHTRGGIRPPGVGALQPPPDQETVYLCPVRRCSRHAWPSPGETAPPCAFSGQLMREDRL